MSMGNTRTDYISTGYSCRVQPNPLCLSPDPLPRPVFTLFTDHVDDVNTGTAYRGKVPISIPSLPWALTTLYHHHLYEHQRTQATEGRGITI